MSTKKKLSDAYLYGETWHLEGTGQETLHTFIRAFLVYV
jgi:hypothetical protein